MRETSNQQEGDPRTPPMRGVESGILVWKRMLQGDCLRSYEALEKKKSTTKTNVTCLKNMMEAELSCTLSTPGTDRITPAKVMYLKGMVSLRAEELMQQTDQIFILILSTIEEVQDWPEEGEQFREHQKWKKKFEDDWKEEGTRIKTSIEALYDNQAGLISSSDTCIHRLYGGPGKTWTQAQLLNLSTNLNGSTTVKRW